MKYLWIKPIYAALHRIHNGGSTQEPRTGTATLSLLRNYYAGDKYEITAEQIQEISKRCYFSIESYTDLHGFKPPYVCRSKKSNKFQILRHFRWVRGIYSICYGYKQFLFLS